MTDVVLVAIIGVVGTFVGSLTGIISAKIADSSRAKNDNRLYISKTQYDLEYGIYRELSKKAFALIVDLSIIYTNNHFRTNDTEKNPEEEIRRFKNVTNDICDVQDILHENAPFIPESIFDKYDELYSLAKEQFWIYLEDLKKCLQTGQQLVITDDSKNRVEKIDELYKNLNKELRKYLFSLSIVS